ncbi:MAG: phage holin family protein [Undibacterium sp.]|nr:phage holin family protein [Opitutaceae bacterium]
MNTAPPVSPLAALGSAPRIVLEGLVHRGELATLELVEARNHATLTTGLAGLAAALTLLAGFASTFTLAALVWQREDRGLILGLVTLVYVLGAVALGWIALRRLKTWSLFAETRHQLGQDYSCLRQFFPPATP